MKPAFQSENNIGFLYKIRHSKFFLYTGIFMSFCLLAGLLFYYSILWGCFGRIPNVRSLKAIENPVASEIYAADGSLLGKFYIENRTYSEFDDISEHVIRALVATEDERFYKHRGVDMKSYGRVIFKTILGGDESSGGGSTISQQLAKNLFPRKDFWIISMPVNKIKEAIIASRLERIYSKNEILTLYLNTVPFGERAFGIATATERFFSTTPDQLTIEQAATLIGMLKATSTYSPRKNPENSLRRRNIVLKQMMKQGYVSEENLAEIQARPLGLKYNRIDPVNEPAPYFRSILKREIEKWSEAHPREDGSYYNVLTDGLKIHTSIHPKMQAYAENAVEGHMKQLFGKFREQLNGEKPWGNNSDIVKDAMRKSRRYKRLKAAGKTETEIKKDFNTLREMKVFSWNGGEAEVKMSPLDSIMHYLYFMNAGFVVMDAKTGAVKAWVGGIDYNYFKVDHVTSRSQVGSTFKPFVYAAALETGTDACKYYPNERRTYKDYDDWSPRNASDEYGGAFTLKGGLAHSVNTVSVQVLFETGMDKTIWLAQKMGITNPIPEVPSIALGTAELSLLEMVGAYTTFANDGKTSTPHALLKIEDSKGNLIHDFEQKHKKGVQRTLSSETNETMIDMMQSVVNEGTGRRLRFEFGLDNPIAGKTGTTQNQTDGWFIGCTPDLVAGAWVGAEDKRIRFATTRDGQGARTALPIWGRFFRQLYQDEDYKKLANHDFPKRNTHFATNNPCPLYSEYMPIEDSKENTRTLLGGLAEAILGRISTNRKKRKESEENRILKERAESERKILEAKKKKLKEAEDKKHAEDKVKRETARQKRLEKRRKREEARKEKNRKIRERKAEEKRKRMEERKRKAEEKKRK